MTNLTEDDIVAQLPEADKYKDEANVINYKGFIKFVAKDSEEFSFLTHKVSGGLIKDTRDALKKAEAVLNIQQVEAISKVIESISGLQYTKDRKGNYHAGGHGWGYCIDINYRKCPYLIGERGEQELDRYSVDVYNDISMFLKDRPSIIPHLDIACENMGFSAFYDRLKEESDDFKLYFGYLDKKLDELSSFIRTIRETRPNIQQDASVLKEKMKQQYFIVTEHPILWNEEKQMYEVLDNPHPLGQITRASINKTTGEKYITILDRPFKNCDPRDGFLDYMPKELVTALRNAGMEWGGCDMGSASGDIMHFQRTKPKDCFKREVEAATVAAKAKAISQVTLTEVLQNSKEALDELITEVKPLLATLKQTFPQSDEIIDPITALLEPIKATDATGELSNVVNDIIENLERLKSASV